MPTFFCDRLKFSIFFKGERNMWSWVITNVVWSLILPAFIVLLISLLINGRWDLIRLCVDLQLCLFSTTTLGTTLYDISVVQEENGAALADAVEKKVVMPEQELLRRRSINSAAASASRGLSYILVISAALHGIAVGKSVRPHYLPYQPADDTLIDIKVIAAGVTLTLGTLLIVLLARDGVGLLNG